jgi:hypothetical protein
MDHNTKTVIMTLAVVAIVALCVKGCMILVEPPTPLPIVGPPVAAPAYKFSLNICNAQDKTELHYENQDPPNFEVQLRPTCFSGFVFIPVRWQQWRVQFLGQDHSAWEAYWYQGWAQPRGPITYDQLMMSAQTEQFPSKMVRLQGKGTLRFYKIN